MSDTGTTSTDSSDWNRIVAVVSNNSGVLESLIDRDANLVKDYDMDSLAIVELMQQLEEEFDLIIPDQEWLRKLNTVGDIEALITRLGGRSPVS